MTKEETKKAIEVMQAYVDGKHIQARGIGRNDIWGEVINPMWDFDTFEYRIKPEKKLRPYTFEEMCEAVKKHGLLVNTKGIKEAFTICGFDETNVFYKTDTCETYEEFLNNNVWLDDNSPCGIIEEE